MKNGLFDRWGVRCLLAGLPPALLSFHSEKFVLDTLKGDSNAGILDKSQA